MAINTYGIVLKWGESSETLTKKVDIKDFPDLGGAPEMLETTTLSDPMQTYILGIQSADLMEFTCNYDLTDYETVEADSKKNLYYSLSFGVDGDQGVFTWRGQHSVHVVGKGVNEVNEMVISIAPASKPTLTTSP